MDLVRDLAAEGRIVVVVMHDLDLAVRRADQVVIIDEGRGFAQGAPGHAVTPAALAHAYGVHARVERCSRGRLRVMVHGPPSDPDAACALGCQYCATSATPPLTAIRPPPRTAP